MKNFLGREVCVYFVIVSVFMFMPVKAAELGNSDQPLSVEVHGFASQGFMVSTENNYLTRSKRGSFEFSEVGLNFTKQLTENLRTGVQLFARKLGNIGNYNVTADWFYLDYRFADEFGLRAGRIKIPFGLYNDTSDIDAARVPILLPQSIYTIQNRSYLLAQSGGELYGRIGLHAAGTLEYRVYGGAINLDIPTQSSSPTQLQTFNNPYLVGGRLLWESPLDGLRLGGSLQALRLDADLTVAANPTVVSINIPAVLWVGSAEYTHDNLLLSAEYSRWYTSIDSSDPTIFPGRPSTVSERAYAMASYRFTNWFQPGVYYSIFYPDDDNHSGREKKQYDAAATLRFDINPYWLVKLEGHYLRGTAGLNSALNGGRPLSTLPENWALFLIKTTVYF